MNRRVLIIVVFGAVLIGVAATATAMILGKHEQNTSTAFTNAPALVDGKTLAEYPKKSGSSANLTRIAHNLIPPTNSWISGAVLQSTPQAVYPMPFSFLAKDTGFEVGLPTVHASQTTITGSHTPGIAATLASAAGFSLTRFDKISATLVYRTTDTTLGNLTLAEGSPFMFYRAESNSTLTLTSTSNIIDSSSSYVRYEKEGHAYAVAVYDGAKLERSGSQVTITAPPHSLATFYALPDTKSDPLHEFASNELSDVTTSSRTEGDKSLTVLNYRTVNSKQTVFAPMAYSQTTSSSALLRYDSIYGTMTAIVGNEFTLSSSVVIASDTLDVSHLSAQEKARILESLHADVASTSITATDSYFAGKALARAANLLELAKSLGAEQESAQLIALLNTAFSSRLDSKYFYYDTSLHGIAATTAAFGSEDFNDHHFHYGYFLYAASILATYDKDFLAQYRERVNLLAADIASYATSANFPKQRYYDPYAQHSWAAGLAPFADGNNQESSSEAINAWNGAALWGKVTSNHALEASASWMLANESATAQRAWRLPSSTLQDSYLKAYASPVSSLNFGGKRTYGTFFSDESSAKLGIQLIPMTPVMTVLADDRATASSVIARSIQNDNYNVPLGDYVLMYLSLIDPAKANSLLSKQTTIDDGNSKSYLEAWVLTRTEK